ncbi:MAG TPA: hypothetical protein VFF73_10200 [Planctomycetota bacterium]|nr:hypothetical protein [Planctomycetota bacterium]
MLDPETLPLIDQAEVVAAYDADEAAADAIFKGKILKVGGIFARPAVHSDLELPEELHEAALILESDSPRLAVLVAIGRDHAECVARYALRGVSHLAVVGRCWGRAGALIVVLAASPEDLTRG